MGAGSEIGRFLWRHRWWLVGLAFPGSVLVTLIHEGAHAAAVWFLGGEVMQFVWWPTEGHWGFVRFRLPDSTGPASQWVALAPYVVWSTLAAGTWILSHCRIPEARWLRQGLFLFGFVVPLADLGNTALGYVSGDPNDFRSAWGPPTSLLRVFLSFAAALVVGLGFGIQNRLYQETALSPTSYGLLVALFLGALTVVGVNWG